MPPIPDEPPVTSSGKVLRLRHVDKGRRSYFEVACPGEPERTKPSLTQAEYDAAVRLRGLWMRGCMNPEASSSSISRLGMPKLTCLVAHAENDERNEAQDRLRAAMRAMGSVGMGGRLAVEVVVYERRVTSQELLHELRCALSRLAEHFRSAARRAA
jgi:hypothetical protein